MKSLPRSLQSLTVLSVLLGTASLCSGDNASSAYQSFPFEIEQVKDRIVPIDVNGDGLTDLLTANKAVLSIFLQRPITGDKQPYNFAKADITLNLPGKAVGWDLDWNTLSTQPKALRIVALVDGKQVLGWPIENNRLGEQQTLLSNLTGNLPLGAYPLDFVRDINDDRRNDFIVPGADQHNLYIQDSAGGFIGDIRIKSNLAIQSNLKTDNELASKIGQKITIPNIRIRDVNGDKIKDIISNANNLLEVFLAKPDGSYNLQPNYSYDFNEVEERLGEPSFEEIDFSNLSSMTRYSSNYDLNDITGDGIDDLLIREAGKVVFYAGTATGMKLDQPQQVLRSSGNVFAALLLDEDNDKRKDLWLMRVEDISLGKAFVWLALSGSINIEAFIYRNEGQNFARRPHRKKTITIAFPSLLKSLSIAGDMEEKVDSTDVTRTSAATISGEQVENDLLILDRQGIHVHLKVLKEQLSDEDLFLGLIKDIREKDEFTIDLNEILSNVSVQGQQHLAQVANRSEDFILTLGSAADDLESGSDLLTMDFNSDHRDDILVFTKRKDDTIYGVLFLSK